MRSKIILVCSCIAILLSACQEGDAGGTDKEYKSGELPVNMPYPRQSGDSDWSPSRCSVDFYPCPPVGTGRYQTMEDFPFIPVNTAAKEQADEQGMMYMHDLYQMRSEGKKLLFFMVTAGWCSVCNVQNPHLNTVAQTYPDVIFLIVVAQDANGEDATLAYAKSYGERYAWDNKPQVFVTNDSSYLFERYMNIAAYPFNAFIDLKNMQIIGYESGLTTSAAFSSAVSSALSKVK